MTTESAAPEVLHVWAIYLRASEEARRRGDRRTGTDHVLLALLEDPSIADDLAERGWMLQVNATSLTGRHGPEPEELAWSLLERGLGKLVASDGHRTTRPAHLDEAHALAHQRLGDRALALFDGSALGVTPLRTASRAASTGA